MRNKWILLAVLCLCWMGKIRAGDTTKTSKWQIGGLLDFYYAFDFNQPKNELRPYFVTAANHHTPSVNLVYLHVGYTGTKFRFTFRPGYGSYLQANYAPEPLYLQNLVEANLGFRLSKKKKIWLDLGIHASPYTNESAYSRDHLSYSRSLAPEYVPYYVSGAKLTWPLSEKTTLYVYAMNGWQTIVSQGFKPALGTHVEWKYHTNGTLNFTFFAGDAQTDVQPQQRTRLFFDAFWIHGLNQKWSFTADAYFGMQERTVLAGANRWVSWQSANIQARFSWHKKWQVSGRLEYFNDPHTVQIQPLQPYEGFSGGSITAGIHFAPFSRSLIRLEARSFISTTGQFIRNEQFTRASQQVYFNVTYWF